MPVSNSELLSLPVVATLSDFMPVCAERSLELRADEAAIHLALELTCQDLAAVPEFPQSRLDERQSAIVVAMAPRTIKH